MSKEDELAKELVEVVPNTYGDLHDAPVEYIEILSSGKVGETKTIPQDTVITSLDDLLFGRVPEVIREEVGDSFWNLADFIDKMPHGIVDKKIPGIGATTLEINSKRNWRALKKRQITLLSFLSWKMILSSKLKSR